MVARLFSAVATAFANPRELAEGDWSVPLPHLLPRSIGKEVCLEPVTAMTFQLRNFKALLPA